MHHQRSPPSDRFVACAHGTGARAEPSPRLLGSNECYLSDLCKVCGKGCPIIVPCLEQRAACVKICVSRNQEFCNCGSDTSESGSCSCGHDDLLGRLLFVLARQHASETYIQNSQRRLFPHKYTEDRLFPTYSLFPCYTMANSHGFHGPSTSTLASSPMPQC